MPELPDIAIYIEALEQRIMDETLARVQIGSPFLLRTAVPPIVSVEGKKVAKGDDLVSEIGRAHV